MGAAVSSTNDEDELLPDRVDVNTVRALIESTSHSFGVRWLDGFDELKDADGQIDIKQLETLLQRYCGRHAGSSVRQSLVTCASSELGEVLSLAKESMQSVTINTVQWNIAGVNNNPFEWKSTLYESASVAVFFEEMDKAFKTQMNEENDMTVGELLMQLPSTYTDKEASDKGGHVASIIVNAAATSVGSDAADASTSIVNSIRAWKVATLLRHEKKNKTQIFSKPDMWLKSRKFTLCALTPEGCADFFLCPEGDEEFWTAYVEDLEQLVQFDTSQSVFTLSKLKGKGVPGCPDSAVVLSTKFGWVLLITIFDALARRLAQKVLEKMSEKHSDDANYSKELHSDIATFVSSMAVEMGAKSRSLISTLQARENESDIVCLEELNFEFEDVIREQLFRKVDYFAIDAADSTSHYVMVEPQFAKIYLSKAKFTSACSVSTELFEIFLKLGGRESLGQKVAASVATVCRMGEELSFFIVAMHTQAKDRGVMLEAVREMRAKSKYSRSKLVLCMDANLKGGEQQDFTSMAKELGLNSCYSAAAWDAKKLANAWTVQKERSCMQTQLHKTGCRDLALKDFIFFDEDVTCTSAEILNDTHPKTGELVYTNVFCPHPAFASDHALVTASTTYSTSSSPTPQVQPKTSPQPRKMMITSQSEPTLTSQFKAIKF